MKRVMYGLMAALLFFMPVVTSAVTLSEHRDETPLTCQMKKTWHDGQEEAITLHVKLKKKPVQWSLPRQEKAFFTAKNQERIIMKHHQKVAQLSVRDNQVTLRSLLKEEVTVDVKVKVTAVNQTVTSQTLDVQHQEITILENPLLKEQPLWQTLTEKAIKLKNDTVSLPIRLPKSGKEGEQFSARLPKTWTGKVENHTIAAGGIKWQWQVKENGVMLTAKEAWEHDKPVELLLPLSLNDAFGDQWQLGRCTVTREEEKHTLKQQDTSNEKAMHISKSDRSERHHHEATSESGAEKATTMSGAQTVTTETEEGTTHVPTSRAIPRHVQKQRTHRQSTPVKKAQRTPRKNLNDSGIITSATITPSNVNDGDTVRFQATFKEQFPGQIQPNDSLVFTLPSNSQGYVKPYHKTITVYDNYGDAIGTLTISGQQATLTFNDKVKDKSNISGSIYFDCEARNLHRGEEDNTLTFDTNFGISTIPKETIGIIAHGHHGQQPSKSPFYYKTGRMSPEDTNHVRWWLSGNLNKEWLGSDIYIEDKIQDGHEMDWNSFMISFTGGELDGKTLTIQELENQGIGKIYKKSDKYFILKLNKDKLHNTSFTATYLTKIVDDSKPTFSNHSKIWYSNYSGDDVGKGTESNFTVDNVQFGGSIHDNQANLMLKKCDYDHHNKMLKGAEFKLTSKLSGKTYKGTTDDKGNLLWRDIPFGEYTLEETRAPQGYDKLKTVYNVTIGKDGIKVKNQNGFIVSTSGANIVISNQKTKKQMKIPNTGGTGVFPWLAIGSSFVIGASLYLGYKRKEVRK